MSGKALFYYFDAANDPDVTVNLFLGNLEESNEDT